MKIVQTNLYRIDEVLIKTALIFLVGALFGGSALVQKLGQSILAPVAWMLLILAPIVLFAMGYAIRKREKQIVGIHRLVNEHGEMPVADLVRMTGFSPRQLHNAVALLNRKSVAGLVWDEHTDSIRHISLGTRKTLTHSQKCGSCGAAVNVEISSLSRAMALACPYCNGALDSRQISTLQNELHLQEGRQYHQKAPLAFTSRPRSQGKPFNWVLFIFLMMFIWPVGVFYVIKYASSARHLEEILNHD